MKKTQVLIAAGILLSISFLAHSQAKPALPATPKPAASVEGHIICSDGNAPARGAVVHLHSLAQELSDKPGPSAPEVKTDFYGYYRFSSVAPGIYVIHVSLPGYNDNFSVASSLLDRFDRDEQKKILGAFPQVAVGGAGAYQQDVVIRRGTSITGRITMDSGGLPGYRRFDLESHLIATTLFGDTPERDSKHYPLDLTTDATTDDRGYFRIAGLPPGQYKLSIHVWEDLDDEVFGKGNIEVFAPEALDESQAEIITLADGEDRSDTDINIPTRLLHSISGTVTLGGQIVPNTFIRVSRQGDPKDKEQLSSARTNQEGDFRLDLVPPGTYILEAQISQKGQIRPSRTARITVSVSDNDISGANIEMGAPTKSAAH